MRNRNALTAMAPGLPQRPSLDSLCVPFACRDETHNQSPKPPSETMKHTPLYDRHMRDASMVINLKGFARAMQYRGHVAEHRAVRERASLCDVSHMGEIEFEGPDALPLVQKLITNDASKLAVNQALYSVMCNANGFVIDDLVCLRLAPDHFIWVVNVTKTDEDFQWVLKHKRDMNVKVSNISTDTALVALQGPMSREVLQRIAKADLSALKYYWFVRTLIHTRHADVPCIISRTGYTGEHGYEIMVSRDLAPWIWDEVLLTGRPLGVEAHGVAARESLRTEAGYLLNGNDMDNETTPFEAGLGWVVKFTKDFIGKDALTLAKNRGVTRKLVGLEIDGPHTVRNGYPIYAQGTRVGQVTSGPLSSNLTGRNLGLGYVAVAHADPGTELEFEIRGKKHGGRVVALPFCERKVKQDPAVRTYSPYGLRFSDKHLWARTEDGHNDVVTIGISDFGQRSLGDILSVELPKPGHQVKKGDRAGWMDGYRRAYDIILPLTGEVLEVNEAVVQNPGHVNSYPYAASGLMKLRLAASASPPELMAFEQYAQMIRQAEEYDGWSKDRRTT
jgi:aminomethyltransferase